MNMLEVFSQLAAENLMIVCTQIASSPVCAWPSDLM